MLLAALTFLTTVLVVPGLPNGFYMPRWVVLGCGAAVLLFLVPRIRMGFGHWCGVAFLTWTAVSIHWSVSPYDTIQHLLLWSIMGAVFCIAAEADDLKPAWAGFVAGMVVTAGFAISQELWRIPNFARGGNGNIVAGLFINKNIMASLAVMALVPAIAYRWWLAVPFLGFVAIQPQSRTAYLMMAIAGAAWLMMRATPRGRWIAAAISFCIVIGTVGLVYIDTDQWHRLISLNTRLAIWQIEVENTHALGWGLGTFQHLLPMYEFGHSEYFQLPFESGIGAIFIAALVVYALGSKAEIERVVFIAFLVECLLSFPFRIPTSFMVAALAAGHLCGHRLRHDVRSRASGVEGLPNLPRRRSDVTAGSL